MELRPLCTITFNLMEILIIIALVLLNGIFGYVGNGSSFFP